MHSAKCADAFTEPEIPSGGGRDILIEAAQPLEIGRIGDEDPRYDARLAV